MESGRETLKINNILLIDHLCEHAKVHRHVMT